MSIETAPPMPVSDKARLEDTLRKVRNVRSFLEAMTIQGRATRSSSSNASTCSPGWRCALAKTSQPPKPSDLFSGTAWTVTKTPDGYQVLELELAQGQVIGVVRKGEPNLKEIAPPVIEGLVADRLVGGSVA